MKQKNYIAGLYFRLSQEDERQGESASIEHQRTILYTSVIGISILRRLWRKTEIVHVNRAELKTSLLFRLRLPSTLWKSILFFALYLGRRIRRNST